VFNIPELTFIPADYANDSLSGLQILSVQNKKSPNNDQKVVIKESFFLLWIPKNQEIDLLKRNIAQSFSSIPLDKVIFCNINLPEFTNEQNNYNETGLGNSNASSSSEIIQRVHLTTIMGIMIPLSQSIDLLLNIPISQNNNQISILPKYVRLFLESISEISISTDLGRQFHSNYEKREFRFNEWILK
jgi:hypothetical protein